MLGELVRAVLERALEAELAAHLGYARGRFAAGCHDFGTASSSRAFAEESSIVMYPAGPPLGTYVSQQALQIAGPVREIYHAGPRDTDDSSAWRTEIGWPIFQTAPRAL